MKAALKHIVAYTYKPLLVKYLSRVRWYHYENIRLEIPPEVFHPGFFFSTRLLLKYIKHLHLPGTLFWEPGCGSGLISIYAARKGAIVTASDINPVAIEFLKNSRRNQAGLTIIQSDLFREIPVQVFDIIAINPPYYKKQPLSLKDYAWHCGENGEYFNGLFTGLNHYIHHQTRVYMDLFEGCDMGMTKNMAGQHDFNLTCVHMEKNLLEKHFICQIEIKS